jgi:8-oxo-dGTP diphosphatase
MANTDPEMCRRIAEKFCKENHLTQATVQNRPLVGVGVIVWKNDKILLGKRTVEHGFGFYSLPGGHLEYGEEVLNCAHRELLEETNLKIEHPILAGYTDDIHLTGKHYVTIYIEGDYVAGELKNMEPHKVENWDWYPPNNLPQPLWSPIKTLIRNYYRFI